MVEDAKAPKDPLLDDQEAHNMGSSSGWEKLIMGFMHPSYATTFSFSTEMFLEKYGKCWKRLTPLFCESLY
jgi:hypothetical protein